MPLSELSMTSMIGYGSKMSLAVAAGCLVSYLLGITSIDPIKYNLIFERFLIKYLSHINKRIINYTHESRKLPSNLLDVIATSTQIQSWGRLELPNH